MKARSQLGAALAVARKELREGLRDRQTVLYTFLLPVALYPVLFWVMVQGALLVRGQEDATNVRVEVVEAAAPVEERVRAVLARPDEEAEALVGRLELAEAPPAGSATSDGAGLAAAAARARLAQDEGLAAVVVVGPDPAAERTDAPRITIYYDSTRSRSGIARRRIEERLRAHGEALRAAAAEARGVSADALEPLEVRSRDLATSEEEGALALSLLLPMLLVVMAVLGTFFPAVDLTAGEKERRTVETTRLLPVPRTAVHLGKILAVTASGMVAASLNILALGLSAGHLLGQMGEDVAVELPLGALLAVAPLTCLFVFFVASVLTGVAGLAASFKEGQALLGPVQMVFIFPAMAASLPGLGLTYGTALVPIVNVALAFRELLVGHARLGPLAVTAAALLVYALLALRLSVRLLSREGVALAGETIPLKRLLALLKGSGDTR